MDWIRCLALLEALARFSQAVCLRTNGYSVRAPSSNSDTTGGKNVNFIHSRECRGGINFNHWPGWKHSEFPQKYRLCVASHLSGDWVNTKFIKPRWSQAVWLWLWDWLAIVKTSAFGLRATQSGLCLATQTHPRKTDKNGI